MITIFYDIYGYVNYEHLQFNLYPSNFFSVSYVFWDSVCCAFVPVHDINPVDFINGHNGLFSKVGKDVMLIVVSFQTDLMAHVY